ncbi:hypothetical protein [Collinsella sp. TM05-37]|jgi:hypothetical protein|uniref:hypothetical protein n=1 Tax=Collinsella sp. TM05-37 TaxID=2292340 RepID=UPI0018F266F9|nr:hypothetical protein [Collinsella sp. TM05-37]
MQLALRIPGIHKTLAPYPDIKIEFIGAGEWNTASDGYGIGSQIVERVSTRASSHAKATVIDLGAYL